MTDQRKRGEAQVTATVKAADLPEGSIVASRYSVYIKREGETWLGTGDDMSTYDWEPQSALDHGAVVLREGYGDE